MSYLVFTVEWCMIRMLSWEYRRVCGWKQVTVLFSCLWNLSSHSDLVTAKFPPDYILICMAIFLAIKETGGFLIHLCFSYRFCLSSFYLPFALKWCLRKLSKEQWFWWTWRTCSQFHLTLIDKELLLWEIFKWGLDHWKITYLHEMCSGPTL